MNIIEFVENYRPGFDAVKFPVAALVYTRKFVDGSSSMLLAIVRIAGMAYHTKLAHFKQCSNANRELTEQCSSLFR